MKKCHRCGHEWVSEKKQPSVKDFCEQCSAYLHCCLNCRFYEPSLHNQCAIPTTDWVGDKEAANFCDEFEFRDADAPSAETGGEAARKTLEGLFGEAKEPEKGVDDFKKLFGD